MSRELDVVILAYGSEPLLSTCVQSVLASEDACPTVYLVDNGSPAVAELPVDPRVHIISPGANTGYAGGCNLGAAHGSSSVVAFVNSDVILERPALAALADRLSGPEVGLVTGCLLLLDEAHVDTPVPTVNEARINTVGNPVHWAGFSWCGGYGEPRRDHLLAGPVASISGGLFAVRRQTWDHLGGFEPRFFAYHEDVDLSLRCWISGGSVMYEPVAVGWHAYEFSRNRRKAFLVERNRLLTWLTVPSGRTWRRIAVPFLLVQLMAFAKATLAGEGLRWLLAGLWVLRHPRFIARRRADVQRRRVKPDEVWLTHAAARLDPPSPTGVDVPRWVNAVLGLLANWAVPARAI